MANSRVTEVTDSTFEQAVLQSEQPVLVDFWASWCGPCKALAPSVEQIAADYEGRLKVLKLDVDSNTATSNRYAIRGIPALLMFRNGKLEQQIVGYVPKETISESVLKLLS